MSRFFIDTNVLIYAAQGGSRFHLSAREALQRADEAGDQLWISRQVVREYLSVMTRPGQIVPYDPILPRAEAIGAARTLLETFWVAEDGPEVMDRLFDLIPTRRMTDPCLVVVSTRLFRACRRERRGWPAFAGHDGGRP